MNVFLKSFCFFAILIDAIAKIFFKILFFPLNWYLGNFKTTAPGPQYYTPFGQIHYMKLRSPVPHIKNLTWYYMQIFLGMTKLFEKEGMFWICFGLHKRLILFSPDNAQVLLNHSKELNKSSDYGYADDLIGKGLLTSDGEMWKRQRRMCQPAFNVKRLGDYLPIVIHRTKILTASLEEAVNAPFIDIRSPITRCAFDCIIEVSSGIQLNSQLDGFNDTIEAVNSGLSGWMLKSTFPWWRINLLLNFTKFGRKYLKSISMLNKVFTDNILKVRTQNGDVKPNTDNTERKYTFVEWLISQEVENPEDILTNKEIRDQVITFVGAGYDTTAAGLIMALYLIGLHSDVQERLVSEINSVMGENSEEDITMEQMKDLRYLDCVLQETQRLYPSVPLIGRRLINDLEIGNHFIPKGTDVYVYLWALHRRQESFPNPERFDPDRFLPNGQAARRHPLAYAAFSAGPRNCIGRGYSILKSKVIITSILRKFEIKSLDERDKVIVIPDIISKCYNDIRMSFKIRS